MSIVAKMQSAIAIIERYQLDVISLRIDYSGCSIHIDINEDMKKFGESVQVRERNSIDYPTELVVEINGIEIFSLVEAKKVGAAS